MRYKSEADLGQYPFSIPAIKNLEKLEFHSKVTFLVGENGAGKSTFLEAIAVAAAIDGAGAIDSYGGKSLDEQSHGESFLALMTERLRGNGLYIFDEPELSPSRQMTLLTIIHKLIKTNSQFIIATHSPIVMAYPDAQIYLFGENGIAKSPYEETEHFKVTKDFLLRKERMLDLLLGDE